ncbi:Zn-ribbon domain-containing OB-fold protein [Paralcaligenes ginsengisoli]
MSESSPMMKSAHYWERTRSLGFALPHCSDCGRFHFYPRPACPFCGSDRVLPTVASGRGSVYSYSVVHRAPGPAFAGDVPYAIAIVATDEGPHLLTRVAGVDPARVRIGMRVRVLDMATAPEPLFESDETKENV